MGFGSEHEVDRSFDGLLKARRCDGLHQAAQYGLVKGYFPASGEGRSIWDRHLLFNLQPTCILDYGRLTNNEPDIGKGSTNTRGCRDEQIDTFTIGKS